MSETINTIKKAGIKFWMLTGDKVETAINIGYSCGVLDEQVKLFRIEQESKQLLMNYITTILRTINIHTNKKKAGLITDEMRYATVIEGSSFFKI